VHTLTACFTSDCTCWMSTLRNTTATRRRHARQIRFSFLESECHTMDEPRHTTQRLPGSARSLIVQKCLLHGNRTGQTMKHGITGNGAGSHLEQTAATRTQVARCMHRKATTANTSSTLSPHLRHQPHHAVAHRPSLRCEQMASNRSRNNACLYGCRDSASSTHASLSGHQTSIVHYIAMWHARRLQATR
jgi:hypothetical protein